MGEMFHFEKQERSPGHHHRPYSLLRCCSGVDLVFGRCVARQMSGCGSLEEWEDLDAALRLSLFAGGRHELGSDGFVGLQSQHSSGSPKQGKSTGGPGRGRRRSTRRKGIRKKEKEKQGEGNERRSEGKRRRWW